VASEARTVTLADTNKHVETLGMHDASMLKTLKPGDDVEVTYKEAVVIDLQPVWAPTASRAAPRC
jgi:hypothetical protein